MSDQISFLGEEFCTEEQIEDLERQVEAFQKYAKQKRNWENAFQKWSNEHGMQEVCTESWGACGYGSMCDWCEDNSYGRPCVRALNAMLREKQILPNYSEMTFEDVWNGKLR